MSALRLNSNMAMATGLFILMTLPLSIRVGRGMAQGQELLIQVATEQPNMPEFDGCRWNTKGAHGLQVGGFDHLRSFSLG
jgi:hypothetical protein